MIQGKVDASVVIAGHLANTSFLDLPASVVQAVKASILDTLGCMLAGTAGEDLGAIRSWVVEQGGVQESTLVCADSKAPPANAVLLNAAMVHQHDYDDTHDVAVCHPTSASLPTALALGEKIGGVSGKDFITAVALGNDLTGRVALAIRGRLNDYPWFRAPVVGAFGATAASAKILGATAEQHLNAMGLMLPMIGGTLASLRHHGSSVRSIRDGLAYRNAVLAAELAMRGLRGDPGIFEGPYGFYHAFMRGEYDRDKLAGDLGVRYEAENISLKPWPSIRHLHRTLTAVTTIMAENALGFDDVAEVLVRVGQINNERCVPVGTGMVPTNRMDLLANMPFAVGAAIRHGAPRLALYRDPALADDVVLNAMPKVRCEQDASLDGPWTFEPASVEIRTVAGRVHVATCDQALGHPGRPMSAKQQRAKFLDCAQNAIVPIPEARASAIIDLVDGLEQVEDIRALAKLLA